MAKSKQHPLRRWFSDGPALAWPPSQCLVFSALNLALFALLNMFYLRVVTGQWYGWPDPQLPPFLVDQLLAPINAFQFPAWIFILGLIMALLCAVPILVAQFYNILVALPFVAAIFFLGHNRILTLAVLIGAAAAGFQPLRFKSRFVAAVVCLSPAVLYWIVFAGRAPEQDVLRQAVLYLPWLFAFIAAVLFFGIVIAIGHFVRYRPGVLTPVIGAFLAGVLLLFHFSIGMTRRDFQAHVISNSPDRLAIFRTRSLTPAIDRELAQRLEREPYLSRAATRDVIRLEWLQAMAPATLFGTPENIRALPPGPARRTAAEFREQRTEALDAIARFTQLYPADARIAHALYYAGRLLDTRADTRALDAEVLQFYDDVPTDRSRDHWTELLSRFPDSPPAVEARWRLAYLLASHIPQAATDSFQFDEALQQLAIARSKCESLIAQRTADEDATRTGLRSVFSKPQPTMTLPNLLELRNRIGQLEALISPENRTGHVLHEQRLARFVALDPHQLNYPTQLKALLLEAPQPDPLLDNVEFAEAMLIRDLEARILRLTDLARQYPDRDGGLRALLELATILHGKFNRSEHESDRELLRSRATAALQQVIDARPDSFFATRAQRLLQQWPQPN